MTTWYTADIAREFKVARKTVTDKWTKRPDFPKPQPMDRTACKPCS